MRKCVLAPGLQQQHSAPHSSIQSRFRATVHLERFHFGLLSGQNTHIGAIPPASHRLKGCFRASMFTSVRYNPELAQHLFKLISYV